MKKLLLLLASISLSPLHAMTQFTIHNDSGHTFKVGKRTIIKSGEWKPFQCPPNSEITIQANEDDSPRCSSAQVTIDKATTLLSLNVGLDCYAGGIACSISHGQRVSRPLIIRNRSRLGLLITICRRFFGICGEEIKLAPYSKRALTIPYDVHSVGIWEAENGEIASPADTPNLSVALMDDTMGLDIDTKQGSLRSCYSHNPIYDYRLQATQLHFEKLGDPIESDILEFEGD